MIELDVLVGEDGAVVLAMPTQERTAQAVAAIRAEAERESDDEARAELAELASAMEARDAAARQAMGARIERRSWPFRAYTYGEKLRAQRECTTWDGGTPRLDAERMGVLLACSALGMSEGDLEASSPALVPMLVAEVRSRVEPTVAQLRFFASSPIGSETRVDAPS